MSLWSVYMHYLYHYTTVLKKFYDWPHLILKQPWLNILIHISQRHMQTFFSLITIKKHKLSLCRYFRLVLIEFSSVQFHRWVMSNSLRPHGLQHDRLSCPSPTPGAYSNSCPLNQWYHLTISSSVVPFASCPQSFLASGAFQMSQFFASGGQSIGVSASASVLPMNIQDWFPLGWTG